MRLKVGKNLLVDKPKFVEVFEYHTKMDSLSMSLCSLGFWLLPLKGMWFLETSIPLSSSNGGPSDDVRLF